jgi:two-component system sensor histidine kinase PilS (NtrC family)
VAVDSSLELRLKKLMAFRLVMVTTLLLIASYLEAVSEKLLPVNPLYFLIGATYVLTVFHALALRFLTAQRPQVYTQVVGDLLIITGLVYSTGGVRPGFALLYPISVLSGSVLLLSRRGGLFLALLATLFYGSSLWAVRLGWVPPQGLSDVPFLSAKALSYAILLTGVACGTVALIGSYLAESLRHAGERLEEAVEEVADLRGLNEAVVDSIHSGLLTVDGVGRILHVNAFGELLLGRRLGEIRGRLLREILGSWLFDPPALRARAADRKLARLQFDYERPDGSVFVLGVSVSLLSPRGRTSGGYLLVFQDLTEIKKLEQEARTNEKLAAVGEMAAHLAHEIRNPLGSISGSAQVLLAERSFSPEQERLLSIITRESKRLSDALNQFLFQAKSSSDRSGPVDIRSVIAEAVTLLRNGPEVGPERVVEFVADEGPLLCLADRDQITQVFWNLARNGLEAMPEGGTLQVALTRAEDDLVLSVRDQGRGMGREEQRHLFQPFQTGSRVGTGLGLAIVYRIVREHGGDIVVRSVPSLGTEVEVRLPLVPATVQA